MIIPMRGGFSDSRKLPLQRQSSKEVDVFFGQLGRDGLEEIRTTSRLLLGVPLLQEIINAMPVRVAVLNDKGQVILTNRCWNRVGGDPVDCLLGKRHGEMLGCIRCEEGPDGCGTARGCGNCGAASSILESQHSRGQVTCEFRLYRRTPDGPTLEEGMVTTTPIQVDGRVSASSSCTSSIRWSPSSVWEVSVSIRRMRAPCAHVGTTDDTDHTDHAHDGRGGYGILILVIRVIRGSLRRFLQLLSGCGRSPAFIHY